MDFTSMNGLKASVDEVVVDREQLHGLPAWLEHTKEALVCSSQWQDLLNEVYHQVKKQLHQNHIESISDLNKEERALFMAKVESYISSDEVYRQFVSKLTDIMDTNLAAVVDQEFQTDTNSRTKVELLVKNAADASSVLLRRLPKEKKSMLRIVLNAPFPKPLRWQAWQLYLINPLARKDYEQKIRHGRIDTISSMDTQITQKCQNLLETLFTELEDSEQSQRYVLMAMKTALSYFHTLQPEKVEEQGDSFYKLIIPIMLVYGEQDETVSSLVEAYTALQELPRPRLMRNKYEDVVREFQSRFFMQLKMFSPSLLSHIRGLVKSHHHSASESKIDLEVTYLAAPYVEDLFVGLASTEVCLYVWDQCLLIGFDRLVLPFCVAFFVLLEQQFKICQSYMGLKYVVKDQSAIVSLRTLQSFMESNTMGSIRKEYHIESNIEFHEKLVINHINMDSRESRREKVKAPTEIPESSDEEEILPSDEEPTPTALTGLEVAPPEVVVVKVDQKLRPIQKEEEEAKQVFINPPPKKDPPLPSAPNNAHEKATLNDQHDARIGEGSLRQNSFMVCAAHFQTLPSFSVYNNESLKWPRVHPDADRLQDTCLRIFHFPENKESIQKLVVLGKTKSEILQVIKENVLGQLPSMMQYVNVRENIWEKSVGGTSIFVRPLLGQDARYQIMAELKRMDLFEQHGWKVDALVEEYRLHNSFNGDGKDPKPGYSILISLFKQLNTCGHFLTYGGNEEQILELKRRAGAEWNEQRNMKEKAMKSVYKKAYSKDEIAAMDSKTKKAFDKNYPKFVKAYEKLHQDRNKLLAKK